MVKIELISEYLIKVQANSKLDNRAGFLVHGKLYPFNHLEEVVHESHPHNNGYMTTVSLTLVRPRDRNIHSIDITVEFNLTEEIADKLRSVIELKFKDEYSNEELKDCGTIVLDDYIIRIDQNINL